MKKLSEQRTLALIVLIAAALLAVPLLGGLGLKIAEAKAAREFSSIASNRDAFGNNLFSDSERIVDDASAMLEAGKSYVDSDLAQRLSEAISACKKAKNAVDKYEKTDKLYEIAGVFYKQVGPNVSEEMDNSSSNIVSVMLQLRRLNRPAYNDYLNTCTELTASWPASSIAKLWNIGG